MDGNNFGGNPIFEARYPNAWTPSKNKYFC